MSKPIQHPFVCSCGHSFEAAVFKSANVTLHPHLKAEIFSGQFNRVHCSRCRKEMNADVPFLYHDMDAGLMVWVYPLAKASQAAAIRDKVRKSHVIVETVLPLPGAPAGSEVVFGVDALRDLVQDSAGP